MSGTPLTAPAAATMAQNATGPFKNALIKYVAAVKKLTNVSQINGATATLNPELISGIKYAVNKANLYAKAGANGQVPGNAAATAVNAAAGAVEAGAAAAINPTQAAPAAVNANVKRIMNLVKIPPVNNKSSYNSINAAIKALYKVGKGSRMTYGGPLPAITNKNRQIVKNYLNKLQSLAQKRNKAAAFEGVAAAQATSNELLKRATAAANNMKANPTASAIEQKAASTAAVSANNAARAAAAAANKAATNAQRATAAANNMKANPTASAIEQKAASTAAVSANNAARAAAAAAAAAKKITANAIARVIQTSNSTRANQLLAQPKRLNKMNNAFIKFNKSIVNARTNSNFAKIAKEITNSQLNDTKKRNLRKKISNRQTSLARVTEGAIKKKN